MRPVNRARRARARRCALPPALLACVFLGALGGGGGAFAAGGAMGGDGTTGPYRPMGRHGMANAPDVAHASAAQLAAARSLLRRSRIAARRFATVGAARRAGYRPTGIWSADGMEHFNQHALDMDRHVLDPWHPESLVFMRQGAGRSPMLAALMFRASSDRRPPHAGRIIRWHVHIRCGRADARDARQMPSPACAAHQLAHYGPTQMTHVWFARRLADAFSMHPSADLISGP
jgi:hypothetical protein